MSVWPFNRKTIDIRAVVEATDRVANRLKLLEETIQAMYKHQREQANEIKALNKKLDNYEQRNER